MSLPEPLHFYQAIKQHVVLKPLLSWSAVRNSSPTRQSGAGNVVAVLKLPQSAVTHLPGSIGEGSCCTVRCYLASVNCSQQSSSTMQTHLSPTAAEAGAGAEAPTADQTQVLAASASVSQQAARSQDLPAATGAAVASVISVVPSEVHQAYRCAIPAVYQNIH